MFHAIVACGATIVACGTATTTGGDASTDASADVKKKPDAGDGSVFETDAQDEADAFDPPDVVDEDVGVVIKPPIPIN